MNTPQATSKAGNAYGRPARTYDKELCDTGPGTPCGEYMRRFWHPIACSRDVTTRPKAVRFLNEDLILFRDGRGRLGLLYPRCAHRGTTLYYGKVDEEGIRCCYHGWKFDVRGRCLDQPCEPNGGEHRERVRQPWYYVEECYGLVFAYMGPQEKKPVMPRWDILEDLGPEEEILSFGPMAVNGETAVEIMPWNWLADFENTLDPLHVPILHTGFSGTQFSPTMAILPQVTYESTQHGAHYSAYRKLGDGREFDRISPAMLPNVRSTPDVHLKQARNTRICWVVPVDDTHHTQFNAVRTPKGSGFRMNRPNYVEGAKKHWIDMSEEEHQRFPGDWEAQLGAGTIAWHSEEHMSSSDAGVSMLRRLLREQIRLVQAGGDPMGVTFDPAKAVNALRAGNYFRETA